MVADDVVYINEPHESGRHITSKEGFRKAFEGSPCIWAEEAKLEVHVRIINSRMSSFLHVSYVVREHPVDIDLPAIDLPAINIVLWTSHSLLHVMT